MSITVKYFASLRERVGRAGDEVSAGEELTVAAVWALATGDEALPEHVLAAVNHEYVKPDQRVADGDEVAFFPPVTGG
jgi:molybdopterin synthase sulfur carrier subunit